MKRGISFLTAVLLLLGAQAAAGDEPRAAIPLHPALAAQLDSASTDEPLLVLVSGNSTATTRAAVEAIGLAPVEVFERLSVVAAVGPPHAVVAVHAEPGVIRVDPNLPLQFLDSSAHRATGIAALRDSDAYPELEPLRRHHHGKGLPYDGSGVSIAVIDGGFDPTHEQFMKDGESKFDLHLRQGCPLPPDDVHWATGTHSEPIPGCDVWVPVPPGVRDGEPDHGTIVAAVAAGYPRTTPSGAEVSGVAPEARLVGLSIGVHAYYSNAVSALNWVLENHEDPCGDGSCTPIAVVNNSYGPAADLTADPRFDPDDPFSRVTTALVEEGVVAVFAAGNDGGDGSSSRTSFLAQNPAPGVLGVGAYDDGNAGDRDLRVADFSSRGLKGDPSTYPDIAAPGVDLLVACPPQTDICTGRAADGAYAFVDGTSGAAPYVSGLVAQLAQADEDLTPGAVEDILEDSAYQFLPTEHFEPDVYEDPDGNRAGNADHTTSFDAGHGLVDAVGALSLALGRGSGRAPAPCLSAESFSIADPTGDVHHAGSVPSPLELSGYDVVGLTGSLSEFPGAFAAVVTLVNIPATETAAMRTTVSGHIDGDYFEVDLNRSVAGDSFTAFAGNVSLDGSYIDPDADTVTFVIRPEGGDVREQVSLRFAYATVEPLSFAPVVDFVHRDGPCLRGGAVGGTS
ncbi:MAG: S8 family serine peptidase [Actinobacteria bacterium]|nr:S8 family serine peptidase [Actinomycetota bacterium]